MGSHFASCHDTIKPQSVLLAKAKASVQSWFIDRGTATETMGSQCAHFVDIGATFTVRVFERLIDNLTSHHNRHYHHEPAWERLIHPPGKAISTPFPRNTKPTGHPLPTPRSPLDREQLSLTHNGPCASKTKQCLFLTTSAHLLSNTTYSPFPVLLACDAISCPRTSTAKSRPIPPHPNSNSVSLTLTNSLPPYSPSLSWSRHSCLSSLILPHDTHSRSHISSVSHLRLSS